MTIHSDGFMERSDLCDEAISSLNAGENRDCFVALLLAMTMVPKGAWNLACGRTCPEMRSAIAC